jgi:hypothetical protein
MVAMDKVKQGTVDAAVDMYLKYLSTAGNGRVPRGAMPTIFKFLEAPWMTRSMIYSELKKRRRRQREPEEGNEQKEKVIIENIPCGVPLTIVVNEDELSAISVISGYGAEDSLIRENISPEETLRRSWMQWCGTSKIASDEKELLRMTKVTATLSYMHAKAMCNESGRNVPHGVLRRIILEAAENHDLSSEAAMGISCRSIRIRALSKRRGMTPDILFLGLNFE